MKRHLKNRTVYRIYTEDVNRTATLALLGFYFSNVTVTYGLCLWHGKREATVIMEIVSDGQSKCMLQKIKQFASDIKVLNDQEEILVTETKADIRFLN